MTHDEEWVIVAKFGRTHGIKGSITVISFTEPRENILRYKPWYRRVNAVWQPIDIQQVEINNKYILAKIEGFNDCEQAAALTNQEIAVKREILPMLKPGEYYWHQLVGMKVINQQQIELGTVLEIMPTGSNDVLVVVGEKRHLIPYLPDDVIVSVDDEKRQITVDWDADF